jgi:hypothetical protein
MTESPPELWQLEMIYDYIDEIPMEDVNWLLGKYGNQNQLDFWTATYSRTNELISRLEEDYQSIR